MDKDKYFQLLLEKIKDYQDRRKELYGWVVVVSRHISYQRLLYPDSANALFPEVIRNNINAISYVLTVYTHKGNPPVMGMMHIKIDPLQSIDQQIDTALESSLAVENRPWELVPARAVTPYQHAVSVDPDILADPVAAADKIVKMASIACSGLDEVKVNYAELFVNIKEALKVTSTGITMPFKTSTIYYEIAMEKLPLPNRQEIHNHKTALTIEGLQITQFIKEAADATRVLGNVEVPDTDEKAVILVPANVINEIFHCLLEQLDASREYMKRPFLKVKEKVHLGKLKKDADPIHLRLDPYLDFMAESVPFTDEGLNALAGTIIEKNVVKQRKVSNRISQYLGIPVNPVTGNIVLQCGSRSYEELTRTEAKVIEILTFSSLLLNPDYLTYSSEIKLAREFNNRTGRVRYLKGGIVSGSIRENLCACQFSNNQVRYNTIDAVYNEARGYAGPGYMLIRTGVAISGK